jgi:hypothetical protein
MTAIFVGFEGSLADAKHLRRICARYAHIEAREGCADPDTKPASDPDVSAADDASRAGIDKGELSSMSSWNVCQAPKEFPLPSFPELRYRVVACPLRDVSRRAFLWVVSLVYRKPTFNCVSPDDCRSGDPWALIRRAYFHQSRLVVHRFVYLRLSLLFS